jgi:AraC-like DNA-binding protein
VNPQFHQNDRDFGLGHTVPRPHLKQFPKSGPPTEKCLTNSIWMVPGSIRSKQAAIATKRVSVEVAPITLGQLLANAREEMGRLAGVLQQFKCGARVYGLDGNVLPLSVGTRGVPLKTGVPIVTSVMDPAGNPAATLELITDEQFLSGDLFVLLGALLGASASALAERWFRIQHRSRWVVLAMPLDEPSKEILLALDRTGELMGANASARETLAAHGQPFYAGLSANTLFQGGVDILSRRGYCDRALILQGVNNALRWSAITTPPAGCAYSETSEREVLHTRPRQDVLRCIATTLPHEPDESGLPPRVLRLIAEYIDSHLDAPLNVDDLASSAGISTSHFSRCFRNSVGLTPHSYVMRRRLLRAQHLLLATNMALSQVALTTGFSDQSHFSRKFHQFMGLPPRSFRLQHR